MTSMDLASLQIGGDPHKGESLVKVGQEFQATYFGLVNRQSDF